MKTNAKNKVATKTIYKVANDSEMKPKTNVKSKPNLESKAEKPTAKISEAPVSTKEMATTKILKDNYILVSPQMIIADENENPRTEYGDIEELMLSLIENGIRNPLKGYKKGDKIVLKDGHRRMRAVNLALAKGHSFERVPMILETATLNSEERTLEFLIYNDGKPLTMLEQSEVINRLLNFGWKITEVVKRTGKARGYIDNLIMLTKAPAKIQNYIREGKISAHAVIQIMQALNGDMDKLLEEVENAIKKALAEGKNKATPKHITTQKVMSNSFGKFYKWAEEIADELAGRKDIDKAKEEVLNKLMISFENGQAAFGCIAYFIDKTKVKTADTFETLNKRVMEIRTDNRLRNEAPKQNVSTKIKADANAKTITKIKPNPKTKK